MSRIAGQELGVMSQENAVTQHPFEVFSGAASPAEARVYARVSIPLPPGKGQAEAAGANAVSHLKLAGHLIGPQCDFANTLPARLPFQHRSTNDAILAEAIVPDPCFWTPELPFLYRAELELRHHSETIAKHHQSLGIRRFGVRGRDLQFEGKRFVLRGVAAKMGSVEWGMENDDELAFARETWTAAVVARPSDAWCELASRRGALTIADLTSVVETDVIDTELQRIARWPAVAIALLDADATPSERQNGAASNLTLAQYVPAAHSRLLANWAKIAFVEVSDPRRFADQVANYDLPIVAVHSSEVFESLAKARAACDRLQASLASHGNCAGYIV